jgi:radical SAM protein with 4Fe4S-binding SPASM domain
VPPVSLCHKEKIDVTIEKEDARLVLDSLVEVKKDTGIMIGTLVSYPLCFLGDLEKYSDFVGRGCPAQGGHRFSINANGDTHACVHEEKNYGNIFEIGLGKAYQNMISWRDGSFRFKGCLGCDYIEICQTGCRSSALAYYGALDKQDHLMENKNSFVKHYKMEAEENVLREIVNGARFIVPQRLRFRKENGFYLVNIRWANTITVSNEVGEFLMKYKVTGDNFGINEFGRDKQELLLGLFLKDVVESKMLSSDPLKTKAGLSIDLAALPVCK